MERAAQTIDEPTRPRVAPAHWAGVGILALFVIAFAVVGLFVAPPDGATRANALRFVGRFHPVLIHLPIGLIVLVPILELAGLTTRFMHLRASAGFVLWLAAISAVVGVGFGYTLAWADGIQGTLLTNHMLAGIATAALAVIALALRPLTGRVAVVGYAASLALVLAATTLAGHFGGQLTYGESYFSEVAPWPIARLLGPLPGEPSAPLAAKSDLPPAAPTSLPTIDRPVSFKADVLPMFAQVCVSCHGPGKVKGGLRLDSYEELMKGGDAGESFVPGKAERSDLYHRLVMPLDDDEVMPPRNAKKRPTPEQIAAVKKWIENGGKGD